MVHTGCADVGEAATADAVEAPKGGKALQVVAGTGIGELGLLGRIVAIPADGEAKAFFDHEGLGNRELRPIEAGRFENVAAHGAGSEGSGVSEGVDIQVGVLRSQRKAIGADAVIVHNHLFGRFDGIRSDLTRQVAVGAASGSDSEWRARLVGLSAGEIPPA